jgi:hypothetical protein
MHNKKSKQNKGGSQMVRRIGALLCLLAMVSFIASPVFAAVQNVKVGGDITAAGVFRNNLDLEKTRSLEVTAVGDTEDRQQNFHSIARVRIDADLSDNVSTSIRLLNERNWNGDSTAGSSSNTNVLGYAALLPSGGLAADEKNLDLDLASITLKEFLYSPLTLTVGRFEARFGNGWIVGDPDTNGVALNSALAAGDLSMRKAWDAIHARLDYNPLILDLVYGKAAENNVALNDDATLYGINAAYELSPQTTIEGFYFAKKRNVIGAGGATNVDSALATSFDLSGSTAGAVKQKDDVVNTIGARVVNKSLKNLTLDAQVAYQFGTYNPKLDPNARFISATNKALTAERSAWGAEVIGVYDLKDVSAISKWEPTITGAYIFLSGADRDRVGDSAYKGWDPMFEDQTLGHLINAIMGFSNSHLLGVSLKAKPAADVTAKFDYVTGWFVKKFTEGRQVNLSGVSGANQFTMSNKANYAHELDLTLLYDYTEDVQLSLLGGVLLPTKALNGNESAYPYRQQANAVELIGSMKVTF